MFQLWHICLLLEAFSICLEISFLANVKQMWIFCKRMLSQQRLLHADAGVFHLSVR